MCVRVGSSLIVKVSRVLFGREVFSFESGATRLARGSSMNVKRTGFFGRGKGFFLSVNGGGAGPPSRHF